MKKIIIGAGILVVLGLIGYNVYLGQQETAVKEPQGAETEPTSKTSKETEETPPDETTALKNEENKNDEAIQKMLKDFGDKWLNYDTVYNRNQSVREYLTKNCIKENGIDVDPKATFDSKGTVKDLTQSIDNDNRYLIIGEERIEKNTRSIFIYVTLNEEQTKISEIKVYYVSTP